MLTDYFDLTGQPDVISIGHFRWEDIKLKYPIFDIPKGTCMDWVDVDYILGKITLGRDAQHWEFLIKPIFLTVPK